MAWLLHGITRSEPGILRFDGNRLTFISKEKGSIFNASMDEISNLSFPWYYLGAGCKMRIQTTEYRLTFIEPNDSGSDIGLYTFARSEGAENLAGRKAAKSWKQILQNQPFKCVSSDKVTDIRKRIN